MADECRPSVLLPGLSAGLLNGILVIICEISFAAMIFSGELSGFIAQGIGLTLFGGFLIGGVISVMSSYPGMVGVAQDGPAAILGILALSIAARMPDGSSQEALFSTIVAAIALSTLVTGVLFLTVGRLKLGNLVRFVPYPVVGGFLAGLGWLLVKAGFGVMTDGPLSLSQVPHLLAFGVLVKWLPGMVYAVFLLFLCRKYTHYLVMPAMFIAAILLFYLIVILTGTSFADAGSSGWFLGPFPEGSLWQPLSISSFSLVHWKVVLGQFGSAGTIFIISFISLLLYVSGLDLVVRRDLDFNHELKATGLANLLAGLGGSPAGYMGLTMSVLSHKMGANTRIVGLCSAGLCGAALLFGASALSYFPKTVAGSMLLFIGLDFLYTWLVRAWARLPRIDYFLVVLILLCIGIFGFLKGVGVGVTVAAVIFIVQYSRIDVAKYVLTGQHQQSKKVRSAPHRWLLKQRGEQIYILRLHGFLFFGTAHNLYDRVRQRLNARQALPLRFLVLDFVLVSGIDSSAINSFQRMRQLAEAQGFTLVFAHLTLQMQRQLEQTGFDLKDDAMFRVFQDLDHALDWCEDQILTAHESALRDRRDARHGQGGDAVLEATFDDMMAFLEQQEAFEMLLERMEKYLKRVEIPKGEHVIRQGEPLAGAYFVESGEMGVYLEQAEGKTVRLRTLKQGDILGESGLYREHRATASVITNRLSILHLLEREKLREMEEEDTELSAELHKMLVRHLGMRLDAADNAFHILADD